MLAGVTELTHVERDGTGAKTTDAAGHVQQLTGDEPVSMNMWGFTPTIFRHLRRQMVEFLQAHIHEEKAEIFIPVVVNALVESGQERVKVLRTSDFLVWRHPSRGSAACGGKRRTADRSRRVSGETLVVKRGRVLSTAGKVGILRNGCEGIDLAAATYQGENIK